MSEVYSSKPKMLSWSRAFVHSYSSAYELDASSPVEISCTQLHITFATWWTLNNSSEVSVVQFTLQVSMAVQYMSWLVGLQSSGKVEMAAAFLTSSYLHLFQPKK